VRDRDFAILMAAVAAAVAGLILMGAAL